MLGYYKGEPNEYVMKFVKGQVVLKGRGRSFFYSSRWTTIVSVPMNTMDVDFIFNEITGSFQSVTVQGQITYRIVNPTKVAAILDFSIDPQSRHFLSKDPAKIGVRLINLAQEATRAEIQKMDLEDILRKGAELADSIISRMRQDLEVDALGVEVIDVFLVSVKPTPEVAKALEAGYRETLLKNADQAIYDRRAVAVEQERKIRENELDTDIALERERETLVDLKAANLEKEAEAEGKALGAKLAPYARVGPRVLTALGLKAFGENAEKVGTLVITPELLQVLLKSEDQ